MSATTKKRRVANVVFAVAIGMLVGHLLTETRSDVLRRGAEQVGWRAISAGSVAVLAVLALGGLGEYGIVTEWLLTISGLLKWTDHRRTIRDAVRPWLISTAIASTLYLVYLCAATSGARS